MLQAIQDEERVDDIILHDHLSTGMPYSEAKAKAYGKGPRAVIWPPGHPGHLGQAKQKARVLVWTLSHVSIS